MRSEDHHEHNNGRLAFSVDTDAESGTALLAEFHHRSAPAGAPGDLLTDLEWLGGDLEAEFWHVDGEVERGDDKGLHWSSNGRMLAMSMLIEVADETDLAGPSHDAYLRMVRFARSADCPWLLRLWNFVPDINRGDSDRERYRRFCAGRNLALEESGITEGELCAGTAVGTMRDRLIVHVLAGQSPGIPVENPRQVAAYHYPRIYGPRSPSFARATALPLADGRHGLLVSGTASIVGHNTIHPGELMPQLDETILNLQALIGEARDQLAHPGAARFEADSLFRVYLREPLRWPEVESRLREVWPQARLAGLHADICRSELMVEIEAFHPLGCVTVV